MGTATVATCHCDMGLDSWIDLLARINSPWKVGLIVRLLSVC